MWGRSGIVPWKFISHLLQNRSKSRIFAFILSLSLLNIRGLQILLFVPHCLSLSLSLLYMYLPTVYGFFNLQNYIQSFTIIFLFVFLLFSCSTQVLELKRLFWESSNCHYCWIDKLLHLCHLAVWPWGSGFASLSLCFHACNLRVSVRIKPAYMTLDHLVAVVGVSLLLALVPGSIHTFSFQPSLSWVVATSTLWLDFLVLCL